MASPAQIAANQLNSRKSTGPRTPEGRANSSMNALKHGNRSQKLALLREESIAFEERLRKWMAIGDAQNDVEEYLVYRNVCLSFELDRAERARVERCTTLIEEHHGDEPNEMGEIDDNVPNEANFDESMSIVEPQQSIEVTANCGAQSALDSGAAEPGQNSRPEQGKTADRDPQAAIPNKRRPIRASWFAAKACRRRSRSGTGGYHDAKKRTGGRWRGWWKRS